MSSPFNQLGATSPRPPPPGFPEDYALAAAMLGRDRKATAEFVATHADAVHSYIQHRLFPRTDAAEDLVQDVFLAAWKQLADYRGEASLRGWLLGIARHKVEDYYRAHLREPAGLPEDDGPLPPHLQIEPNWDELMDQEALAEQTRRTLARLPDIYRIALLWRYWEKRSTQEMAELTGKTGKGMERLLARAREQFRKRWNDV